MAKKRGVGKCRSSRVEVPAYSAPADPNEPDDDQFNVVIDRLYEKRAVTRLDALQQLNHLLCSTVWQEECIKHASTLARLLLSSIRRGSRVEGLSATRALGLLVVTLGMDDGADRVWNEIRDPLIEVAANKHKSVELRCAAVETYAVSCFVAENDPFLTLEAMAQLSSLWSTDKHSVQAAAILGWTLLLSPLATSMVRDIFDEVVERLIKLVEDTAVDVGIASSEAVALLYSFGAELDSDGTDSCDDETSVASNSTGFSRMSGLEFAVDRMRDQAGPKGQTKKRSKKDRSAMRSTFRDVCHFMEDGVVQQAKIKLNGATLVIDDMPSLTQLSYFRKVLGAGFQVHLRDNEVLHEVFQYSPSNVGAPKLTKAEKRMIKSPQSITCRLRTKERRDGYTAKMEMLEACGF